jgi:hypothetical protein
VLTVDASDLHVVLVSDRLELGPLFREQWQTNMD